MEWADAKAHCEELTEGGFDDWHMANITELRTLIQNCDSNMHSGTCGVVDTPSLSCLSKNSCAADCNACPSEAHSKFGETQPLMSSSKNDESDRPWSIFFNTSAAIGDLYFSGDGWQFRCVRNDGSKLAACTSENGTLSGDTCTRQCSGKPANSEWNGSTSYALTYSGGAYIGGVAPEYSETQGTCHFKCADGYIWTGSQCLPECSETSATPCYDSSTGYIWSEAFSARGWQNALNYCTNLNGNNYGGYSAGWHLPNINELRTLVQNCAKTQLPPQTGEESCAITYPDHLSYSGDWTDVCQGCTYDANNPGKYSKLGDTESFWSSSIRSDDSNFAWYMDFLEGYLYGLTISESNYVRCVRKINQ